MCNVAADVMLKLENTVRQFLDEGRMFTGYDVTLETRDREKMQLRHENCRGAIHEMSFLSDAVDFGHDVNGQTVKWAKTQISMGNGAWAFVYHPAALDPNTYQPRQSKSVAASSVPVATNSVPVASAPTVADTVKDSGGENSDGTFSPDYRNRLFIQKKFVQGIGLNAGGDVYIVADSSKQTIGLYADQTLVPQAGNGIAVSTQRIERNGDFRLSGATLRSAGLNGSKFKVEQTGNVIEIFEN